MKLILFALHIFLIGWLAYQVSKHSGSFKKLFLPALIFKLCAGIAVGLIYNFYYKVGDTLIFFEDGKVLSELARTDFFDFLRLLFSSHEIFSDYVHIEFKEPRAVFFVKIVSVFSLLSYDSYWVISLYFSFFSFLASWYLVLKINQYFPEAALPAVIAFLFFPTAAFWSAGLLKETLAMASIFFLSQVFIALWFSEKVPLRHWLLIILCAWLTWQLKYYFAAVFFSVAATTLVYKLVTYKLLKLKHFVWEIFLWLLIFIVPILIVMLARPNFHPQRLLHVIVENYNAFNALSAPEDLIRYERLEPNFWRVLANVPWALFSGLFRPLIWESHNLVQFLAGVENLALLLAFAASVVSVRSIVAPQYRMLIFCVVMYIILLCIFLTLSTPNFGTLSRYRVSFLPYFVFILLCSPYNIKILRRSFNRLVQ